MIKMTKQNKEIEDTIISVKRNYPGLMGEKNWKKSTSYERALIQQGKQELSNKIRKLKVYQVIDKNKRTRSVVLVEDINKVII